MTEGYPLITTNRHRGKKYIEFDGETLPFIKRPHLDILLHASNSIYFFPRCLGVVIKGYPSVI